MKHKINTTGIILSFFIIICTWHSPVPAEGKNTLFSNQKRPVPSFDHVLHEDSLGDEGCARCHHVLNTEQNKLVYAEGEEAACSECHSSNPSKQDTALREASHASCTACHRSLKKEKKPA
ncbi:MAG: cytochrome c family protein, partial [Proteobacteria bacterium]|nr:cytochrome c family protein [Pseudomonadota bacterium]